VLEKEKELPNRGINGARVLLKWSFYSHDVASRFGWITWTAFCTILRQQLALGNPVCHSVCRRFDGQVDPACPYEDRQRIAAWLSDMAKQGAGWARDILDLKPCDLWPQLRGRTTWVIGDSISQVSIPQNSFQLQSKLNKRKETNKHA
jgi:hypothetical protein